MSIRPTSLLLSLLVLASCENGASTGAACARASDCRPGLVCRFDRCRAECLENRDCDVGQTCLLAADGLGACTVDADLGCESGVGRECPTGLVCVSDRCLRACSTASDCPSDGQCLLLGDDTRFCFDGRSDAGLPDASVALDAWSQLDTGELDGGLPDAPLVDARPDASLLRDGVLDVCIGPHSACAIAADRTVWCWGSALLGQLGEGGDCTAEEATARAPMPVPFVSGVDALVCGTDFACAHSVDGRTQCWGANDQGQLARDTAHAGCDAMPGAVRSASPDEELLVGEPRLSAAGRHACIGDAAVGTFVCWGANDTSFDPMLASGAYRRATALDGAGGILAPVTASGAHVVTVALAEESMCVTTDVPSAFCWGSNLFFETGTDAGTRSDAPVEIGDFTSIVIAVIAGRTHRCLLDASGTAACWGDTSRGQIATHLAPIEMDRVAGALSIAPMSLRFSALGTSGSSNTTCGVVTMRPMAGEVVCWGDNATLQAGVPAVGEVTFVDGAATFDAVSTAPGVALDGAAGVAVGPTAACAIDVLGALYCWGDADLDPSTAPSALASAVVLALP